MINKLPVSATILQCYETFLSVYHVRYLPTWLQDPATQIHPFQRGSSNLDQPFQVATLAPKLTKPFGMAPPTLILDLVFLIWINSHVVLFIDVYLLKYSYSETSLRCVNKSFHHTSFINLVIGYSVCAWQAFPAYSIKHSSLA